MKTRHLGIGVAILAAGCVLGWRMLGTADTAHAADAAPAPPVPVTTTTVKAQDVPVYLGGLGTVQAFNTVQIKAQVNGTLIALPAREGQEVHKGDIIAEIDPRSYQAAVDQATAQREEDAAQLQSAQLDLTRYQDLAKRQFAPVQQVDDQQATVNRYRAAVAADTASIENARINLDYCVIHSPIDGRVSLYQIDVGNIIQVASQSPIVTITQDKPIAVVFTLPEAVLLQVQDAQAKGELPVQVVGQPGQPPLATGRLMTPNNTIDTTTGTISLKASFPNQDDHLWPGEFVNARVRVAVLHDALTVPQQVVQHGPNGLFVYVVGANDVVAQQTVELGYQDDGMAVVTKGLAANQTVVVGGQSRLAPGAHVKATPAAPGAEDTAGAQAAIAG
jgi:multidrug efflux system membrane fusion protein